MAKMSDLPLVELYQKKITSVVEAAIHAKEDFSSISPQYCQTVCRLKCKSPDKVKLLASDEEVDILIVQDTNLMNGPYDKYPLQTERNMMRIIEFICEQAGFREEGLKFKVVNLLKCELTEDDLQKGAKPPGQITLLKCKPYLLSEIDRVKPKVIISLSTAVTKALGLTKHSNTNNRGEFLETNLGKVVISLHPKILTMIRQNSTGQMWGADYMGVIVRDFKKAADLATGKLEIQDLTTVIKSFKDSGRIQVTRSLKEVKELVAFLFSLSEKSVVSLDTETTGLDGFAPDAKLLCLQVGYRDPETGLIKAVVVPLFHRQNTMYKGEDAWDILVPWLTSKRPKVLHNAKFDMLYVYRVYKVYIEGVIFDTMLLLHDVDSGAQKTYSLKTAIWDYLPRLGLGGYEDLLKLDKVVKEEVSEKEVENA